MIMMDNNIPGTCIRITFLCSLRIVKDDRKNNSNTTLKTYGIVKKSSGVCLNLKKASLKALVYIGAFLKYVKSNHESIN